jgi:hypothetical protein
MIGPNKRQSAAGRLNYLATVSRRDGHAGAPYGVELDL